MAKFFREPDRRQRYLLPVDMADWVLETDLVHLRLGVIGLMDLIHYLQRPQTFKEGPLKGKPVQGGPHIEFWKTYFQSLGAPAHVQIADGRNSL